MNILKMTATFGTLSQQTLTLEPNALSVFTLPNESGKTTWTAFLLCMFYGVNTSERSSQNHLPLKKKYSPWSGEPMSGVMELEHEGRKITIERTVNHGVPFGNFRAYDSETGQDIPELTAENCGVTLLGCEKSVFERSALLRHNALAVTSDSALTNRLAALASTGSEELNYEKLHGKLHDTVNRIKNTLLPQAQKALSDVNGALEQIHTQHQRNVSLQQQKEQTEQQLQKLSVILEGFSYREEQEKQQKRADAKQALCDAEQAAASLRAQAAKLPPQQTLQALEKKLSTLSTLPEQPTFSFENPAFDGLSAAQAEQHVRADVAEYDRLCSQKRKLPVLWILLAVLCCATAAAVTAILQTPLGLSALLPALVFGALAFKTAQDNRRLAENAASAQAILEKYGFPDRDAVLTAGGQYAAAKDAYDAQLAQYEAAASEMREQRARLLGQVSAFCPDCETVSQAQEAISDALALSARLEDAEKAASAAKRQYAMLCDAFGTDVTSAPPEVDLTGWTKQSAQEAQAAAQQRLSALEIELAKGIGAVQSLGDPAELLAHKEALEEQCSRLAERQKAFCLAEQALESAFSELQTRFSPQLCKLAGAYLSKLTDCRYDGLTLDVSMNTTARETDGALTRGLSYLSSGTVDQVYLALRLAIADLALKADTPLILDDALICFDDVRVRHALRLLREQSKKRQIILFSCHSREAELLKGDTL